MSTGSDYFDGQASRDKEVDALRSERDALAERVRGLEEALNDAASELHTARQQCNCYSQMTKHPTCVKRLAVENRCYEALRPAPAPAATAGPGMTDLMVTPESIAAMDPDSIDSTTARNAPSHLPEKPGAGGAMTGEADGQGGCAKCETCGKCRPCGYCSCASPSAATAGNDGERGE